MSLLSDNPLAIAITIVVFLVLGFFIIRAVRKHNKEVEKMNALEASLKVSYAQKLKKFAAEFPDHGIHSVGYIRSYKYELFLVSAQNELQMNVCDYSLDPRDEKDARALKMLRAMLELRFNHCDLSVTKRLVLEEVWIELHRENKEQDNAGLRPVSA